MNKKMMTSLVFLMTMGLSVASQNMPAMNQEQGKYVLYGSEFGAAAYSLSCDNELTCYIYNQQTGSYYVRTSDGQCVKITQDGSVRRITQDSFEEKWKLALSKPRVCGQASSLLF